MSKLINLCRNRNNLQCLHLNLRSALTWAYGRARAGAPGSNLCESRSTGVAKMASRAIFQYNILAIDDTHNTWTNVIVKMTILRLLGSSDDKEKRGEARPEGPPLRGFRGTK